MSNETKALLQKIVDDNYDKELGTVDFNGIAEDVLEYIGALNDK